MRRTWAAALAVGLLVPVSGAAGTEGATFDLIVKGMRAGLLSYSGTEDGGRYQVTGRLQSAGLMALARTLRYEASAAGRIERGRASASRYAEAGRRGDRQSRVELSWDGRGAPRIDRQDPPRRPRSYDIKASDQTGTVDPLTALFVTLRDVAPGEECRRTIEIYDGRRRTRLVLGEPEPAGSGVTCRGEFRRIAGYSAEDLAEQSRFPFRFRYAPRDDGRMRVVEITTETIWGPARLQRR